MADWLGGYRAEWLVSTVNPDTWAESGSVPGVRSVTISRDCSGDVPLLESGVIAVEADKVEPSQWMRVFMVVDGMERVPLATLLFERQTRSTGKRRPTLTLRGRSVLQPAADSLLLLVDGKGYAPAGCDGAAYAAGLIRACAPCGLPVSVAGSFTLNDNLNFDQGATCLEAAWAVLGAGGFCIQIGGDGSVTVRPMPSEPSLELGGARAGLLVPGSDDDFSIIDVPNRYTAVLDGETATAENADPSSPASFPRRGKWKDAPLDSSPTLVNGEDLEAYARRRLAEESVVRREFSYEREFWPGVQCYSMVRASMPDNGVEGDLRVVSQELECGNGVLVSEVAVEEVKV